MQGKFPFSNARLCRKRSWLRRTAELASTRLPRQDRRASPIAGTCRVLKRTTPEPDWVRRKLPSRAQPRKEAVNLKAAIRCITLRLFTRRGLRLPSQDWWALARTSSAKSWNLWLNGQATWLPVKGSRPSLSSSAFWASIWLTVIYFFIS